MDRVEGDRDAAPVTLRPYQLAAVEAVQGEFAGGRRRTLLVLPTGCGKTVVFAELARRVVSLGLRVLVLAHRTELLEQARRKLADAGVWAAIEQAARRAGLAPVFVASVQTLRGKRLQQFARNEFGLVVVDEGHHAPAASYRAILDHFDAADVLGVTATPDRGDGKPLGDLFDSVAYSYELRDAIRDGWLAPIRARRIVVDGVDLGRVHTRAGDFAQDELAAVMATDESVLGTVVPLLEQAGALRTIVFAVNLDHAYALARAICDRRPGAARVGHGDMDDAARRAILDDFRAGRFQFLLNCQLYTEGFDEPTIQCVANVAPTKSRAVFVQRVGRGTRLHPSKRYLLLLDFTGNAGRHKLVGPIDALAGGEELSEELRGESDRLLADGDRDLDGVLDEAAAELERRRKELHRSAVARYRAQEVDLFLAEELDSLGRSDASGTPATESQRAALVAAGLADPPPDLTAVAAASMLAAINQRRKKGLSTIRQMRVLTRHGIDARRMKFGEASKRLDILALYKWDAAAAAGALEQLAQHEAATAPPARRPRP